MTPSFPFELIRVRLERALQHLDDLGDRIKWMGESNPYRVGINRDRNTGDYYVTASIPQVPPYEWSFLISEFSHNLRSALDNLVWQLALKRTATPFIYAGFPIHVTQNGFTNNGRALIRDLSVTQQAMIQRSQPYYRRQQPRRDPLWLLHQINNADKHRFLPVVAQPKFDLGTLRFDGPTQDVVVYRRTRMENGTQLARFRPGRVPIFNASGNVVYQDAQVQVYVQGSLDVRFGEALEDISGWHVLPLMWDIYGRLLKIVQRFETQLSR